MSTTAELTTATECVEVRLRSDEYDSDEAVYLCHAPFHVLERLVTEMGRWGISIDGNTFASTSGQFVVAKWGAGFEIIVNTTDD
jgi:hypothetical protein